MTSTPPIHSTTMIGRISENSTAAMPRSSAREAAEAPAKSVKERRGSRVMAWSVASALADVVKGSLQKAAKDPISRLPLARFFSERLPKILFVGH